MDTIKRLYRTLEENPKHAKKELIENNIIALTHYRRFINEAVEKRNHSLIKEYRRVYFDIVDNINKMLL